MKIRLISVGKDRSGLFEPAVREYTARIGHYCKVELIELAEGNKTQGVHQAIDEEGRRILDKIRPTDRFVALDERGKRMGSRGFSKWVADVQNSGRDLCFCVGGANGISDEVRARADLMLSLSDMTMPHRLARLVIAEQLYRAFTILKGEPYHRD